MSEYQIRKATISDLPAIQELNRKLCVLESEKFDPTTKPDYSLSESGKEYFTSNLNSPNSFSLVAESDGKVIGYILGSIKEAEDFRTIKSLAEGDNMYVEEAFRGKGIGKSFIEQFESWCRERNIQRVRYTASANNLDAIKVYEAGGYKKYNIVLEKEL